MINMKRWALYAATLGPIGYYKAPGSLATCVTLPFVYCLQYIFSDHGMYCLFMIGGILVSFLIIRCVLLLMRSKYHDPSEIVLDEVVGCMVTFMGIPLTPATVLIGVIVFRFFDITKWGLVGRAERISGAWGILADDIVAGLFANIALQFLF